MSKLKKTKGITLISLVITIVILLILAGVTINNLINNGVVEKADSATEETRKQIASEIMNLKITNIQMSSYVENKELASLQFLADNLCEDDDIQYVSLESKAIASLEKINTTGYSSIYTKLKEYPYEFEINSSMQLASIDGVKIATSDSDEIAQLKSKIELLEKENSDLKEQIAVLEGESNIEFISGSLVYEGSEVNYTYNATNIGKVVGILLSTRGDRGSLGTFSCKKNNEELDKNYIQNDSYRRMCYFIIDVNEGDEISLYANCSGSYGDNGYAMYFLSND